MTVFPAKWEVNLALTTLPSVDVSHYGWWSFYEQNLPTLWTKWFACSKLENSKDLVKLERSAAYIYDYLIFKTYSFPSFNSISLNYVSDSVLVHFLKLVWASDVELIEFLLQSSEFLLSQRVTLQLLWQVVCWLERNQEAAERSLRKLSLRG